MELQKGYPRNMQSKKHIGQLYLLLFFNYTDSLRWNIKRAINAFNKNCAPALTE